MNFKNLHFHKKGELPQTRSTTRYLLTLAIIGVLFSVGHATLETVKEGLVMSIEMRDHNWLCPIVLFLFCFISGASAVLAGIESSILCVSLLNLYFPFHFDYVRSIGILASLITSLMAIPSFLRNSYFDFRQILPLSLVVSIYGVVGAYVGLVLSPNIIQLFLGIVLLIVILNVFVRTQKKHIIYPQSGVFIGYSNLARCLYPRTRLSMSVLCSFSILGFVGGMLGMGTGWAYFPMLTMLIQMPVKMAVGSSTFLLGTANTAIAWFFLNEGCFIPFILIPSIVGVVIGSFVGIRLLPIFNSEKIRYILLIGILFVAFETLLQSFST